MATIKKACKGVSYPKPSNVSRKLKSGGSLGMKSVKAGYDKNPGVTRADIIVAGKGKAKKGMKIKKAQNGVTSKKTVGIGYPTPSSMPLSKKVADRKQAEAKSQYEASTNPKVEYNTRLQKTPGGLTGGQSVSMDTTGLAAGAKRFPVKTTMRSGKDVYYKTNRGNAKRAVKAVSNKMGGKTKKK
jgi:hypothetical protein